MRGRTVAVLVVCWGLLSVVLWTSSKPVIFNWAAQILAGVAGADLMANAASVMLPILAAGAAVLFIFALARPTPRRTVAQRTAPPRAAAAVGAKADASDALLSSARRIYIKPEKTLVNSGARFGVVLLGDSGGMRATAPNNEIYFKKLDSRGTLMAQIPRDGHRAHFRCFVDYRGLKFERVKRALRASRFTVVTPRTDGRFRAWFLLPGFKTGQTADGKINTFS